MTKQDLPRLNVIHPGVACVKLELLEISVIDADRVIIISETSDARNVTVRKLTAIVTYQPDVVFVRV